MSKKFSDWVRPGVDEVRARPRTLSRELMRLDLPTLERPRKAISGFESRGQSSSLKALLRNSALNGPRIFADKRGSDLRSSASIRGIKLVTRCGGLGGGALLVELDQFRHARPDVRDLGFVIRTF